MEKVESEQDTDVQEAQELKEIPIQLGEFYDAEGLHLVSNQQSFNVKAKYYKQTYRAAWEQMPDFKGWLRGVVGQPTRAYCTYCKKTLHAHRLSLLKHTCTIRHQKAAQLHKCRKGKSLDTHDIHTVILHQDEIIQSEPEGEELESAVEYVEQQSEDEDGCSMSKEIMEAELAEDETEESAIMMEQNSTIYDGDISKVPIATQVVDQTKGNPVAGLQVSLYKLIDGRWTYINEGLTNIHGKFSNFLERDDFTPGRYKLHFDVDRYFDARKQDTMYPFIEVVFDCRSVTESYNVPLYLSPFGYSTFCGS